MAQPESIPVGDPCWVDLFSSDKAASQAFYGELFGWTAEDAGPDFGHYVNFSKDGQMVAGCMGNDGSTGAPDSWSVYLKVDDAAATEQAAVANGGQVVVPAMQVGPIGSMLVVIDPGQAAIGAWQPGEHKGFGLVGEPGSPCWFELHTRSYDESIAFYERVFGVTATTMSDTPEFRYTTLGQGEPQVAGIMDDTGHLSEDVPPHWAVYFGVADTDEAIATATRLGATLVFGPNDTPYGRLASMVDPTGAAFNLMSVSA